MHFLGYWDATDWVNEKFSIDVKYHWLRKYLIQHFKTKLKNPRKSHYKKDEQAIEAFFKLQTTLDQIRKDLEKNNKFDDLNIYFQDESRFGLKTHIGKLLSSLYPLTNTGLLTLIYMEVIPI